MRSSRQAHACCCRGPSARPPVLLMLVHPHPPQARCPMQQALTWSQLDVFEVTHKQNAVLRVENPNVVRIGGLQPPTDHPIAAVLIPDADIAVGSTVGRHSERLRAAAEALRSRMLHLDPELLVLDKPAGLAVQGGPGMHG